MDIQFATNRLRNQFNSNKELNKVYGPERAKKIQVRMTQLSAADNLDQLRNAPGRCHMLIGNLAGIFSLDLDGPYRLLFSASEIDALEADNSIDWRLVTKVRILEVRNTHD